MIVFDPLWDTLREKGITQYTLEKKYRISHGTMDSLRKNRSITLNTLNDLCEILECSPVFSGRSFVKKTIRQAV